MISEAASLMAMEITVNEAADIIHSHPTCSEAFMFLELVRNNVQAKDDLKRAIAQVTGQNCSIGPYKKQKTADAPAQDENPLDSLLDSARAAGVPVEIK